MKINKLELKSKDILLVGSAALVALIIAISWARFSINQRLDLNSTTALLLAWEIKHDPLQNKSAKKYEDLVVSVKDKMRDPLPKFAIWTRQEVDPQPVLDSIVRTLRGGKDQSFSNVVIVLESADQKWFSRHSLDISVSNSDREDHVESLRKSVRDFQGLLPKSPDPLKIKADQIEAFEQATQAMTLIACSIWSELTPRQSGTLLNIVNQQFSSVQVELTRSSVDERFSPEDQRKLKQYAANIQARRDFIASLYKEGINPTREKIRLALAAN